MSTVETWRDILLWTTLINTGWLAFYWTMFVFTGDWIYAVHTRWFQMRRETFDAIHYGLMGLFKLGVLLFNLVPYIALRLATE